MSMFDFKHHKMSITGLLMRVQTDEYTDRRTGSVGQKIVVQLLCNNYDPETDTFRKPEVEQFSSKSIELLEDFKANEGKIVTFPVSSMITPDGKMILWIPKGTLPFMVQSQQKPLAQPAQSIAPKAA